MLPALGILVVFGAVIAGYLMEHGKLMVLVQPAELVIIGGAAIGTLLVANPLPVVINLFKGVLGLLCNCRCTKAFYLDSLKMRYQLFQVARKGGMAKLEEEIEAPEKSPVFSQYPAISKDHHLLHFICDTVRTSVSGVVLSHDLDAMLEADIDVHHHGLSTPVKALETVGDALPGLGIVAAVLGVVNTMGALGGPPAEIGEKVASALVGTFLGILLCYGLAAPLAAHMSKRGDAENQYYQVLRAGLMAFAKGMAPIIAVEFARRAIPHALRPNFNDMEKACKGAGAPPPVAEADGTAAGAPEQVAEPVPEPA